MRSESADGAREAVLKDLLRPTSPNRQAVSEQHHAGRSTWATAFTAARTGAYSLTGLFLFIFALQMLKSGAAGLKPVLNAVSADGAVNLLGFGWIASYGVMSGSPVAAISLSLFSGGTISDVESFIVLFVGFLQYLVHRRSADGLFIGVVALLTAFTLWLPVLPVGIVALKSGWFDGISVGTPGELTSFIDLAYDPIVEGAVDLLPRILIFGLGIAVLLSAFTIFDRALPNLEQPSLRVERIRTGCIIR